MQRWRRSGGLDSTGTDLRPFLVGGWGFPFCSGEAFWEIGGGGAEWGLGRDGPFPEAIADYSEASAFFGLDGSKGRSSWSPRRLSRRRKRPCCVGLLCGGL